MKFKRITVFISIILLLSTLSGCMMAGVGKERLYSRMGRKELMQLDDEELCYAIFYRDLEALDDFYYDEIMELFPQARRAIFVVQDFLMEFEDGGLCTYCVNSPYTLPYIQNAFEEIGADDYLEAFNLFIKECEIDVNDIEQFYWEDLDDIDKIYCRYPFDKYDSLYMILLEKQPLQSKMAKYIRDNIEEFVEEIYSEYY